MQLKPLFAILQKRKQKSANSGPFNSDQGNYPFNLHMNPKDSKLKRERVNRFRQHMNAAGFRQRNVYVHDDDWGRVKKYLARLRKTRES